MRQKTINLRNQGSFDKKFDLFPQTLSHIPSWVRLVQKMLAKNSHAWAPLILLMACIWSMFPGISWFPIVQQGSRNFVSHQNLSPVGWDDLPTVRQCSVNSSQKETISKPTNFYPWSITLRAMTFKKHNFQKPFWNTQNRT
jgi:hypothetical protein